MIALLSATWDELEHLSRVFLTEEEKIVDELHYKIGYLSGERIALGATGIGIKRARKGSSSVIQKLRPGLIISAGLGGGLSPEMSVGDVVLGENVISLKKGEKIKLNGEYPELQHDYRKADILTENRFLNDPEIKKRLYEKTGAIIVDMETWGIAEAARQSSTPVMSVRTVSDESWERLPDMGAIYGSSGRFDWGKSVPYFLSHPALLTPYLRFRVRNYRRAVESLNKFLAVLVENLDEPGARVN
ncbi:MAG: hypothetical protein RIG61_12355 [Deltaproteobacteria bacterium]